MGAPVLDVPANKALRHSLRLPTIEHGLAADLISSAADAFLGGNIEAARQYLRDSDMPALFRFGRLLMDRKDPEVVWPLRLKSAPKAREARAETRMPSQAETWALYIRDGWRCRYCGCRVIYGRARDVLRRAFPDEVPWPTSGPMHGGFFVLTASADHVVPHSRGGDNSAGNLVTACWPCNFGMEHDSLGELGLSDPRLRPPVLDGWDGLSRLIGRKPLVNSAVSEMRPDNDTHKQVEERSQQASQHQSNQSAWLDRLDASHRGMAEILIEFLDGCRDLGVSWSAKEVLVARMELGNRRIQFFGVEPSLAVQIPWSTNTTKEDLHLFAKTLARGIPGATLRETTKLWNVDMPPERTVPLRSLMNNKKAVRVALEALYGVLQRASGD